MEMCNDWRRCCWMLSTKMLRKLQPLQETPPLQQPQQLLLAKRITNGGPHTSLKSNGGQRLVKKEKRAAVHNQRNHKRWHQLPRRLMGWKKQQVLKLRHLNQFTSTSMQGNCLPPNSRHFCKLSQLLPPSPQLPHLSLLHIPSFLTQS